MFPPPAMQDLLSIVNLAPFCSSRLVTFFSSRSSIFILDAELQDSKSYWTRLLFEKVSPLFRHWCSLSSWFRLLRSSDDKFQKQVRSRLVCNQLDLSGKLSMMVSISTLTGGNRTKLNRISYLQVPPGLLIRA